MDIILLIIAFLIPYLLGSVNFSIVLSKAFKGDDIRNSGSGNAGATNMLRTYGKKLAILTLVLDILNLLSPRFQSTLYHITDAN